jgi:hypothetical protein
VARGGTAFRYAYAGERGSDQLAQLADLRDQGVITGQEFDRQKAKVLAA